VQFIHSFGVIESSTTQMGRFTLWGFGTDFTSQRWLSLDLCGLLCMSLSVSIHLFALFAIGFTLISQSLIAKLLFGILYVPFSALALVSLFMATSTDPGAVPMGARPIPANLASESDSIVTERDNVRGGLRRRRGIRRCRKCNDNYKPARAHHDSVTGRCVVKMDHCKYNDILWSVLIILSLSQSICSLSPPTPNYRLSMGMQCNWNYEPQGMLMMKVAYVFHRCFLVTLSQYILSMHSSSYYSSCIHS